MSLFLATFHGLLTVFLLPFGLHRLVLLFLYVKHRHRRPGSPPPFPSPPPLVLIQIPLFNEGEAGGRLVQAACRIRHPREALSIQILDDSDDGSEVLTAQAAALARSQGWNVEHLTRDSREGFKAGALEAGLANHSAEFVALFDADFDPPEDFLVQTLPWFADPGLALVQARWTHRNQEASLLTRAQAILLDGHFLLDHGARHRSGRFFNFNGTAGLWRAAALRDAGGWQGDTLTEDLDISYRAQMRGWRFLFLPDVLCPAELPLRATDFKNQQHRWAKGAIQTARKLLPSLWRAPLPLGTKVEATFHLTGNLASPLMLFLLLLAPWMPGIDTRWEGTLLTTVSLSLFLLSTASLLVFFGMAVWEAKGNRVRRLLLLPFVLSLGMGLAINNTRAVGEALLGQQSPFLRTPKKGAPDGVLPPSASLPHLQKGVELLLSLGCAGGILRALGRGDFPTALLLLFLGGGLLYLTVEPFLLSMERRWRALRRRSTSTSPYSTTGTQRGRDQLAGSAAEYP